MKPDEVGLECFQDRMKVPSIKLKL